MGELSDFMRQQSKGRRYPTVIQEIDCPTFKGNPNPAHGTFYFAGSIPSECYDPNRNPDALFAEGRGGSKHYPTERAAIDAAIAAGVTHLQGVDCRKIVWEGNPVTNDPQSTIGGTTMKITRTDLPKSASDKTPLATIAAKTPNVVPDENSPAGVEIKAWKAMPIRTLLDEFTKVTRRAPMTRKRDSLIATMLKARGWSDGQTVGALASKPQKPKSVGDGRAADLKAHGEKRPRVKAIAPMTRPKAKKSAVTKETANAAKGKRPLDARIPPVGTIIERHYKGKTLSIQVVEDGFMYQAKTYKSLTGLAVHICGHMVSGFVWFGLLRPWKATKSA